MVGQEGRRRPGKYGEALHLQILEASVALLEGGMTKLLYPCKIHPPSNLSLFTFIRRRDLPSFLRSSSRWMTSHASPSSVLTHARTHECARRSRERAREGRKEREGERRRTDGRTNGRTDEDSATVSSGRISIRNARAHLFVVFSYLIAGAGLLWAKLRMLATFGKA